MDALTDVALVLLALVAGCIVAIAALALAEWAERRKWTRAAKRLPYITED